jgi:cyclopropane fatty-acyl-phospholipid synthase-like methyltransferase
MLATLSAAAWEEMYAPYDQPTYQKVLELLLPEDVVLDIGAGDLQLSRQMALIVRKVYAVEMNASVLDQASASREPLPGCLIPIRADARAFDFPFDTTVGVLMMRHCTHFRLYFEKLRRAGARRLITNARWRMSVEEVDLWAERTIFSDAGMGWYACVCGATGFKAGSAEQWSIEMDKVIHEVADCPQCTGV